MLWRRVRFGKSVGMKFSLKFGSIKCEPQSVDWPWLRENQPKAKAVQLPDAGGLRPCGGFVSESPRGPWSAPNSGAGAKRM